MFFGVLGFWDFFWIALIMAVITGGSATYTRIERVEAKLDRILKHLGLDEEEPPS